MGNGNLELVALDGNGIPQLSISLPDTLIAGYKSGEISLKEVYERMEMSYDTDRPMGLLKGSTGVINRSAWKADIVLYPEVSLENSTFDKLYSYRVNLSPAVEMDLWKGAKATAQVVFPIATNMKGEYKKIRPGVMTISQEIRFRNNFLARIVAGNFTDHRIGAQAEVKYRTGNGRVELGAQIGTTGYSAITDDGWYIGTRQRINAAVKGSLYVPQFNTQLDLQAGRYLYGDYGLRGDCTRHFGEYAVGVYAMYVEGEVNGGFHFAIPLPGKKWNRNHAVRMKPAEFFAAEYSMVSWGEYADRKMGYTYQTRPAENRSNGFFQPEYIRHFLIKSIEKERNKKQF